MDECFKACNHRLINKFLEKVYLNQTSHLQLKHFNHFPIESHIDHVGRCLQPRRIPAGEHWIRDTYKLREKAKERIWSQTDECK